MLENLIDERLQIVMIIIVVVVVALAVLLLLDHGQVRVGQAPGQPPPPPLPPLLVPAAPWKRRIHHSNRPGQENKKSKIAVIPKVVIQLYLRTVYRRFEL